MPLGQNALLAYSAHLGVIVLFTKAVPQVPFLHNTSGAANTLVQLGGIFSVWTVVRLTPAVKALAVQMRQGIPYPPFARSRSMEATGNRGRRRSSVERRG